MAEPFKNMYNKQFFDGFTKDIKQVIKKFDDRKFISQIMDDEWENRELMQRCRHIAAILKSFLPPDYEKAIAKILELLEYVRNTRPDVSIDDDTKFGLMLEYGGVLSDFVQQYGLDHYETSIKAIEEITQFTSCEFAVRPFIIKYPKEMMRQMLAWSKHKHWGVRRLSSEGCRPRLPWGMALQKLKENPAPIIPILENLKNDPHFFVRKSVANNLNDIAKDNPEIVIGLIKKWQGKSKNLDWIIKHGSRTLLKQGDQEVMELFGFDAVKNIFVNDFKILTPKVKIGKSLEFCFNLLNKNKEQTKIRLEYGLYYQKANGGLSKKIHKISEKDYAENSVTQIVRKQSFREVTTRKFHPGLHRVSIIINGKEFEQYDFELMK